jgi:hypothetical protein
MATAAATAAGFACCELDIHSRSETRTPGVSGAHGPKPEARSRSPLAPPPEAQSICRQLRARARAPAETADATRHIQAIRERDGQAERPPAAFEASSPS